LEPKGGAALEDLRVVLPPNAGAAPP